MTKKTLIKQIIQVIEEDRSNQEILLHDYIHDEQWDMASKQKEFILGMNRTIFLIIEEIGYE